MADFEALLNTPNNLEFQMQLDAEITNSLLLANRSDNMSSGPLIPMQQGIGTIQAQEYTMVLDHYDSGPPSQLFDSPLKDGYELMDTKKKLAEATATVQQYMMMNSTYMDMHKQLKEEVVAKEKEISALQKQMNEEIASKDKEIAELKASIPLKQASGRRICRTLVHLATSLEKCGALTVHYAKKLEDWKKQISSGNGNTDVIVSESDDLAIDVPSDTTPDMSKPDNKSVENESTVAQEQSEVIASTNTLVEMVSENQMPTTKAPVGCELNPDVFGDTEIETQEENAPDSGAHHGAKNCKVASPEMLQEVDKQLTEHFGDEISGDPYDCEGALSQSVENNIGSSFDFEVDEMNDSIIYKSHDTSEDEKNTDHSTPNDTLPDISDAREEEKNPDYSTHNDTLPDISDDEDGEDLVITDEVESIDATNEEPENSTENCAPKPDVDDTVKVAENLEQNIDDCPEIKAAEEVVDENPKEDENATEPMDIDQNAEKTDSIKIDLLDDVSKGHETLDESPLSPDQPDEQAQDNSNEPSAEVTETNKPTEEMPGQQKRESRSRTRTPPNTPSADASGRRRSTRSKTLTKKFGVQQEDYFPKIQDVLKASVVESTSKVSEELPCENIEMTAEEDNSKQNSDGENTSEKNLAESSIETHNSKQEGEELTDVSKEVKDGEVAESVDANKNKKKATKKSRTTPKSLLGYKTRRKTKKAKRDPNLDLAANALEISDMKETEKPAVVAEISGQDKATGAGNIEEENTEKEKTTSVSADMEIDDSKEASTPEQKDSSLDDAEQEMKEYSADDETCSGSPLLRLAVVSESESDLEEKKPKRAKKRKLCTSHLPASPRKELLPEYSPINSPKKQLSMSPSKTTNSPKKQLKFPTNDLLKSPRKKQAKSLKKEHEVSPTIENVASPKKPLLESSQKKKKKQVDSNKVHEDPPTVENDASPKKQQLLESSQKKKRKQQGDFEKMHEDALAIENVASSKKQLLESSQKKKRKQVDSNKVHEDPPSIENVASPKKPLLESSQKKMRKQQVDSNTKKKSVQWQSLGSQKETENLPQTPQWPINGQCLGPFVFSQKFGDEKEIVSDEPMMLYAVPYDPKVHLGFVNQISTISLGEPQEVSDEGQAKPKSGKKMVNIEGKAKSPTRGVQKKTRFKASQKARPPSKLDKVRKLFTKEHPLFRKKLVS